MKREKKLALVEPFLSSFFSCNARIMLNLYCSHSWVFLFLSDQQLFAGISYSSSGDMNNSFRNCSENFFSWDNALFSLERYTSICFGASKLVLLQVHRKIVCCRGFFLKDWKEHLSQRYWYFFLHLTTIHPHTSVLFSTRIAERRRSILNWLRFTKTTFQALSSSPHDSFPFPIRSENFEIAKERPE